MPQFQQILMRPRRDSAADDAGQPQAADWLRRCRTNTLALLARGWRIPVFLGHAPGGSTAGGPQPPGSTGRTNKPGRNATERPAGWLVDLTVEPDGSLCQVIEIERDEHARQISAGQLTHSSPEIRPRWPGLGKGVPGPVIAHIALTARPRLRGQTPLVPVVPAETSSSTNPAFEKGKREMETETKPTAVTPDETRPPQHDGLEADAPPRSEPGEPTDAPEQPETDAGESEPTEASSDSTETRESSVLQEPVRPARNELARRIRASRKLPKGLRERLCDYVETMQFSEDGEAVPALPVAEAVEMIEAALPEHLQLAAEQLEQPAHPRGEEFFTGAASQLSDDEAERLAAEQLAATGFGSSR